MVYIFVVAACTAGKGTQGRYLWLKYSCSSVQPHKPHIIAPPPRKLSAIRYYSRYSLYLWAPDDTFCTYTEIWNDYNYIIITHVLKKSQYPVKLRHGKPTCLLAPIPPGRELARPEISSAAISSVEVQLPPGRRQQTSHAWPVALHSQSGSPRATQYVPVQNCWNGENSENEISRQVCLHVRLKFGPHWNHA